MMVIYRIELKSTNLSLYPFIIMITDSQVHKNSFTPQ